MATTTGKKPTASAPAKQPAARRAPTQDEREKTRPSAAQKSEREPSRQEVERRAYELWQKRGAEHGSAQADWLQAERELKGGAG
jgi:hypothetical protein